MNHLEYFARTGNDKKRIPPQTYRQHVTEVETISGKNADEMLVFCAWSQENKDAFGQGVREGGRFHDLGKLDSQNQKVLSGDRSHEHLPIKHDDAGAAYLFQKDSFKKEEKIVTLSAVLAYSHHAGLPDFPHEKSRGDYAFRIYNKNDQDDKKEYVDQHLDEYLAIHQRIMGEESPNKLEKMCHGLPLRLALSCLVDGDYHSAALHSSAEMEIESVEPRWEERLAALDKYVEGLTKDTDDSRLRTEVYQECRSAIFPNDHMLACTSPVGTGKTTAVMAQLLQMASRYKLRRLFVVLPYTNIIQQSVEVYRKALVLQGENPEAVVAEHHHLADFSQEASRQMAVLWNTPIVVTTAVQFFETLASNRPAVLRKLHELPGSAIFVDEAHAAMPLHMWPQEFTWMKALAKEWGCHFIFGSGSLAKIWENKGLFSEKNMILCELLSRPLMKKLEEREKRRIEFHRIKFAMALKGTVDKIVENKGKSRLVVVNTVSSAAAIARELRERGVVVRHLSTALSPADREKILKEIKEMLNSQSPRYVKDWVLVATSCVEAGVDFSFDVGYRECCTVTSLIQLSGRVNRNGDSFTAKKVFSFRLLAGNGIVIHPGFVVSASIVDNLFKKGLFYKMTEDELVQEAIRREISKLNDRHTAIEKAEHDKNYPEVAKKCRVIDADTQIVVVNTETLQKLERGEKVSARELQRNSVQMWAKDIEKLRLPPVQGFEEIYKLRSDCEYDPEFLGYMTEKTMEVMQNPNIF